jgi:hypothetical protein
MPLSDVLGRIPGIAGYEASRQLREQQEAQGLQQQMLLQKLLMGKQAQEQDIAFKEKSLAQQAINAEETRGLTKAQLEATAEYRKGREALERARLEEMQRHNKASEGIAGNRLTLTATSREPMAQAAIDDLAIQSLYDSNVLAGYRRDPEAMRRIAESRVNIMRNTGVTSEDVVGGRAGFKADTASLNKITPQYDAIVAFEQTAIRNGKILKELANKADVSGIPAIERWIRAGRVATGDADVAKLNAQMNLYRAEAARILTQPNLSGILTDTARKEMEDVIRNQASAKQVTEVVDLLERDFLNRKQTLEAQIKAIRTRMRGRLAPGEADSMDPANPQPAPAPSPKPATAQGPKEGDKGKSKSGRPMIFRNGRWEYEA